MIKCERSAVESDSGVGLVELNLVYIAVEDSNSWYVVSVGKLVLVEMFVDTTVLLISELIRLVSSQNLITSGVHKHFGIRRGR